MGPHEHDPQDQQRAGQDGGELREEDVTIADRLDDRVRESDELPEAPASDDT